MDLVQLLIGVGVLIMGNIMPRLNLGGLLSLLQGIFAKPSTPAQPVQPGQPAQPSDPQRPILDAVNELLTKKLAEFLKKIGVPNFQDDQGKVELFSDMPVSADVPVMSIEKNGIRFELYPRVTLIESPSDSPAA